jgi:hypothetical protein
VPIFGDNLPHSQLPHHRDQSLQNQHFILKSAHHITMKSASLLAYSLLLWGTTQTAAFQSTSLPFSRQTVVGQITAATVRSFRDDCQEENFLLDEFKTASGEIVNPYKILKVARDADRTAIRQSYRNLSRMYHPDGARHRTILPGSW